MTVAVNTKFKRKYGLDWPVEFHDVLIDLTLAKHWREEPYCQGKLLAPGEHLLQACRCLFTMKEFGISRWTEEHAHDWTERDFVIIWGCAASSKSSDIGLFCLLDWIVDCTDTICILASTTADMLQYRSFESVMRYFHILKRNTKFFIPGKESKQRLAIINDFDEDSPTTVKASIKGVAVQKGSIDEARANLQGAHLPYVRLVLDEMSQMREAAVEARVNLSIGAKDFKFIGLCNPDSVTDLAGRFSVPKGGWSSVDPETSEFWETNYGVVRRHDGFKSPAITEKNGTVFYPYLIDQKQIDKIILEYGGNRDAPQVWTMIRGWPPPIGLATSILTEGFSAMHHMQDPPIWDGAQDDRKIVVAGCDPAFTTGGDKAILQLGTVGHLVDGKLALVYGDTIELQIEASNPRPATYQLLDQIVAAQSMYGFAWENLGIDDSGVQSLADVVEAETGQHVFRVNFASKASELPVSAMNTNPAKDVYQNRITEYYFALVEYGRCGQIRNFPARALQDFCQRKLVEAKRPKRLEPKALVKTRLGHSPDVGDASAILAGVVREKLGIAPGASYVTPAGVTPPSMPGFDLSSVRIYDVDARKDNYLIPGMP